MTLIVGIKCWNGVVVGADGAATLTDSLGTNCTALQPTKKLQVRHGRVIAGVSGPVGLGQLIVDRVDKLWDDKKIGTKGLSLSDTKRTISSALKQDIVPALQTAEVAIRAGMPQPQVHALTHTLVALPIDAEPELLQFFYQGDSESATGDLPFVSIGSGQPIADPFLAFLRRIFWPHPKLPSLADGIFATVWTLEHAIQTNPGGVASPIQVAVLEYKKNEALARELTDSELGEHRQNIAAAESYLKQYPGQHTPTDRESSPPPPPSNSGG